MPILDFLFRLSAALLMGAVVGMERQWRQRMAGTRTNALVAAGASAFVMCAFLGGAPVSGARRKFSQLGGSRRGPGIERGTGSQNCAGR